MATTFAKIHVESYAPNPIKIHENIFEIRNCKEEEEERSRYWYCAETGIYRSKHPSVELPSDPFLDVASFIFSFRHGGACALVDSWSGFSISYAELHSLVKSMAAGLHRMGVEKGDVVLILVRREGSEVSQAAVIEFVAKQVAPYKKVRRVYFTKAIPKSAEGKILRKELKKLLTSKM